MELDACVIITFSKIPNTVTLELTGDNRTQIPSENGKQVEVIKS